MYYNRTNKNYYKSTQHTVNACLSFDLVLKEKLADYKEKVQIADYLSFIENLSTQIYANASIVSLKHRSVKCCIVSTVISVIFALFAIVFKIMI